jgi:hypothetical protein
MHFFTSSQCFWMALTLLNLKLGGNLEFSWYSCNILRYCSNRCIVWFSIQANCPAHANRKFPVQLYVEFWVAYLHIQNGGSRRIWKLTYNWTGNFLLAWAGQFAGIENETMHRFEQYLKILQLYHENSRFPPSFEFWSVSTIQKHWEEVKKCILHAFKTLKHFSCNPHSSCRDKFGQFR